MTVVNFLCQKENAMMKKTVKITAAVSVAIISLLNISLHNQPLQELPVPEVRTVSASIERNRGNTPPTENTAFVGEEIAKISTQKPPQDSTLIETDFEPLNPADSKEILTESSAPRDNPIPTPAPSRNTTATTTCEPKMGDTRTVGGQRQGYLLGFGWVDYMRENECIFEEGMFENGNKIAIMD